MASADQYRQLASNCVHVASQCPAEKGLLLDMAEMWSYLAKMADAAENPELPDVENDCDQARDRLHDRLIEVATKYRRNDPAG